MRWTVLLILFGSLTLMFGAWIGVVYEYGGENPVGSGVLVWTKCTCCNDSAWDYTDYAGRYGLDQFSGMNIDCYYPYLTADDGEHIGSAQAHGYYKFSSDETQDIELGVIWEPDK